MLSICVAYQNYFSYYFANYICIIIIFITNVSSSIMEYVLICVCICLYIVNIWLWNAKTVFTHIITDVLITMTMQSHSEQSSPCVCYHGFVSEDPHLPKKVMHYHHSHWRLPLGGLWKVFAHPDCTWHLNGNVSLEWRRSRTFFIMLLGTLSPLYISPIIFLFQFLAFPAAACCLPLLLIICLSTLFSSLLNLHIGITCFYFFHMDWYVYHISHTVINFTLINTWSWMFSSLSDSSFVLPLYHHYKANKICDYFVFVKMVVPPLDYIPVDWNQFS